MNFFLILRQWIKEIPKPLGRWSNVSQKHKIDWSNEDHVHAVN